MRKRIFAFVMAVVIAVGCVGYRPQKAYANAIALSSEGFEVLFGLLGSAGVVVGIDKTVESRFEEGQKLFDSLSASQQQSYIDWLSAGKFVTSDTGHRVFQPDMELDTSFYRDLWSSVTGFFDSVNTYHFADTVGTYDGYIRYLPTSNADNLDMNLGGYSDNAYVFHGGGKSSGRIFYFLNDTTFVEHFFNEYDGTSTFNLINCSADSVLRVRTDYIATGIKLRVDVYSPTRSYFSYGYSVTYANSIPERQQGVVWGSDSIADYVYAYPQLYRLNFNPLEAYSYDALIPCDTWVSKWDDAKAEGRQVGIITGQDLSNYNSLDDIYNPDTGLVTGLDIPVSPEIPVTGDLTGIAGGIQSILNWLKSWLDKLINALTSLLTTLFVPTTTALEDFVAEAQMRLPSTDNFFGLDLTKIVSDDGKPRWYFTYKGVEYDIFSMALFDYFRTTVHVIIIALAYYRFYRWLLRTIPSVVKGR